MRYRDTYQRRDERLQLPSFALKASRKLAHGETKTKDKRQKTGFKMLAFYFLLYIRAEHTHSKYKKVTVLSVICQPSADRCGWMLNAQPPAYLLLTSS